MALCRESTEGQERPRVGTITQSKIQMGRSRYKIVDPKLPHFMTYIVLNWIPVFTTPETVSIVISGKAIQFFTDWFGVVKELIKTVKA